MKKHIANIVTSIGILFGVIACSLVITHPSWLWSELLLGGALLTDALDGKMARKFGGTKAGPYLDDIADFINFGLHPGLWIWSITGHISFAALYICCIFYRLVRFTLKNQNTQTYFSGLPSPAAAVGAMGLMIIHPDPLILVGGLGLLSFLTISSIPAMHIMKQLSTQKVLLIVAGSCLLPWIYGGDIFAL
ncbi:CDP-alcohol phosphatidyltransferase family protein [Candidatus Peribacteria bacterium]|nr:CDP-alcohol phosphatidyltransferase family protein [Candidatus Peribacteria bacterium]